MNAGLTELIGYAAAALVLATFSVRNIATLRALAIVSNLTFIAYAASAALPPVLILHAMLLPLNALRLWQTWQRPAYVGLQNVDGRVSTDMGPTTPSPARLTPASTETRSHEMGNRFDHWRVEAANDDFARFVGPRHPARHSSLLAFNMRGHDPMAQARALKAPSVEARAGCHCAALAHASLSIGSSCRSSVYLYKPWMKSSAHSARWQTQWHGRIERTGRPLPERDIRTRSLCVPHAAQSFFPPEPEPT